MGIPTKQKKMRTEPCRVYIRGEYSRIREPLIFERRRAKPRGTIFNFPYEYLTAFGSKIRNNFTIPLMLVGTNITRIVKLSRILDPKAVRYYKIGFYKSCPVDF